MCNNNILRVHCVDSCSCSSRSSIFSNACIVCLDRAFLYSFHACTHTLFSDWFSSLVFFLCICSLVHLIFSWFLVVLFPQQILIWLFSLDLFIFSLSFSCYIALHSLSSHIFLVIFPLLLLLLLFSIVSTINLSAEI